MNAEEAVYTRQYKLKNADVDLHRRLRPSVLFTMLQEAAIAHTEALGMGRDKTLDRGLLWVVTLQRITVHRMPRYDETVTLASWPGKTMHVLFPRYYRMTDGSGQVLLEGSALWTLMDQESRTMVFPDEHGVVIPGHITGWETPLPRAPKPLALTEAAEYTVPYSSIDLNGHMNNVRYLDLAEDVLPAELHTRPLREILVEYTNEAKLGERIKLQFGSQDGVWFLLGQTEKRLFRLRLEYGEAES